MRLVNFEIKNKYLFSFEFEDGIHSIVDIEELIASKVKEEELSTARIDKDWGCLEFKGGIVDIEPTTLYNYVINHSKISA